MVDKSDKPATGSTAKKVAAKDASAKDASAKTAPAKAEPAKPTSATKNVDQNSTKKVGGGTKSHPVSAERLKAAEDVIRTKPITKSVDDPATIELKKRASEAKRRAQEKILNEGYVSDPSHPLERLANTFDTSARRWEMVVYPTMFAFILLAAYGFYLIYHLTHDISMLSKNVSQMTVIVSDAMPRMSKDLTGMTGSIDNMTGNINTMSTDVTGMSQGITTMSDQMTTLRPMNANLANMTDTMNSMNRSVYGMNQNVGNMNRTVSGGPFGMMNDVMPFSSNSYNPQAMSPPMYRPPALAPPPQNLSKPRTAPAPSPGSNN